VSWLERAGEWLNPPADECPQCRHVHVHGSGVWGNRYWCDGVTGVRRVAV